MKFSIQEFFAPDNPDSSHIAGRHWVSEDGRQLDIQSVWLSNNPNDDREGIRVCVGPVGGKSEVLFGEGVAAPDLKIGRLQEQPYTEGVFYTKDTLKEWLSCEFKDQEMVPVRNGLESSGHIPQRAYAVLHGDQLTKDFFLNLMEEVSVSRNDRGFGRITLQDDFGNLIEFRGWNPGSQDYSNLSSDDRYHMTLYGGLTVTERHFSLGKGETNCLYETGSDSELTGTYWSSSEAAEGLSKSYSGDNLIFVDNAIDEVHKNGMSLFEKIRHELIEAKGSPEEREKALQDALSVPKPDSFDVFSFSGSKTMTKEDFDRCFADMFNNSVNEWTDSSVSLLADNGLQLDIVLSPVMTWSASFYDEDDDTSYDIGFSVYAGKAGGESKCLLSEDSMWDKDLDCDRMYSVGSCKNRQELMDWIQKNCVGLSFSKVNEPLPQANENLEKRWGPIYMGKFDTVRLVWKEEPGGKPGEHNVSFARACDHMGNRDTPVRNPYLKNNRSSDGKVNHAISISDDMFRKLQSVSKAGGGPWQGVFNGEVIKKTSRVSYPNLSEDAFSRGRVYIPSFPFDCKRHDAFVKRSLSATLDHNLPKIEADKEHSVGEDLSLN